MAMAPNQSTKLALWRASRESFPGPANHAATPLATTATVVNTTTGPRSRRSGAGGPAAR